jgi:AraC family L-rhamnose operon regulatory protein RhaS
MLKEIITYGRFQCRELSPHKNRGMEITYIAKGNLEWMVEGQVETVPQGSVFFTLPWQVHGSAAPREPDNAIHHVLFHLAKDYASPHSQFTFKNIFGFSPKEMKQISSVLCTANRHCHRATPAMRWLMPKLINELQGNHALSEAHALSYLRAIIVELARIVSGDAVDRDTHTPSEHRAQKLLKSLADSCGQPWTLQEMAQLCGVQRSQLNTIVQKLTGCTPMEYVGRLRIERAKTLLRESDMKVIDIAFECGFGSSQYFANLFRRTVGATPSNYRKQSRGRNGRKPEERKNIRFRSEAEERSRIEKFSSG